MSATSPTRPSRGRRSARPSGDDREQAILETAERLLAERGLADVSVDDLAKGAGLSRPTFYFYFPSKEAVLLTLFERVVLEADAALEALDSAPPTEPTHLLWREGIRVFVETFGAHRAVSLAANLARTNADIAELWSRFMQKWVEHTEAVIEFERSRGVAPVTIPARDLSTALNLLNEKIMLSSWSGLQPAVPDEAVLDTLVHIWTSSIYGGR